jgi:hypothetical protein
MVPCAKRAAEKLEIARSAKERAKECAMVQAWIRASMDAAGTKLGYAIAIDNNDEWKGSTAL